MEKKKRNILILVSVILVVAILTALIIFFSCSPNKANPPEDNTQNEEPTPTNPTSEYTSHFNEKYHWKEDSQGNIIELEVHNFSDEENEDGLYACVHDGCEATKAKVQTQTELVSALSYSNSPTVISLLNNITLRSAVLTISSNMLLDLNEKTLTLSASSTGITVSDGARLTITGAGTINQNYSSVSDNIAILVENGTLEIDDANINVTGSATSQAIFVQSGIVNIYSGTISCKTSLEEYQVAGELIKINLQNSSQNSVNIITGTFMGYNPEEASENVTLPSTYSISTSLVNGVTAYIIS